MKNKMIALKLKLYTVKNSQSSLKAVLDIKNFLEENYKDQYDLEIINVLEEPGKAEQDNVMVTPTLLKKSPKPEKRLIGDMSDQVRVRFGLGLENNNGIFN